MKLVIGLILLCTTLSGIFVERGTAQEVGEIDWSVVTPIYQVPSFFQRFPTLRLLFDLIWSPPTNTGGGNEANRTDYPYTVGLVLHFNDGNGFCGGSLISANWTLTAAHCVDGAYSGIAILGAHQIRNNLEVGQQRYFVEQFVLHPGWDANRLADDVALVRLPQSITFTANIQPLRLPNLRQIPVTWTNQQATLSGWGTSLFDNFWGVSTVLRYNSNHVISNFLCRLQFPTFIETVHLCGVTYEDASGPCPGDSGGPYVVYEADGNPTQIGVTSFLSGFGCERSRPAVFSRLTIYLRWIEIASNGEIIIRPDFDF